ncbi:MAG: hypothetical protein KZQ90_05120 [Candidatus Thiodiazotropha sp. (ex Codakia rugifera)]|nr:hypothetical protein [Candidatus Thiodiazotropha sp. (ex Codakia rugifera)]
MTCASTTSSSVAYANTRSSLKALAHDTIEQRLACVSQNAAKPINSGRKNHARSTRYLSRPKRLTFFPAYY